MKFIRQFNWILFLSMLALVSVGTVAIWSAGQAREEVFHALWKNNLTSACVGLCLYFALSLIDYRKTLDLLSWPLYAGALVLLVGVLLFGSTIYGGRRWLWFFQPSELSKLCLLAFLASFLGNKARSLGVRTFLLTILLAGVPCVLILLEPDLGTTLTLAPAVLVVMLCAGVFRRGLLTLMAIGAFLSLTVLCAVYEAEKPGVSPERREAILKFLPLQDHQVRRVKVFLFPDEDQLGAGYNLRQAKIAIGSGGLTGKGIGKGQANHLKYLPPSVSMNDFIFCVYAEETGYLGSLLLLALFAGIVFPTLWIGFFARDTRGRLLCFGVGTLVFAHVYVNIAMSIGLLPITGLPLPFISSGRTFLVTVMCALGLVQSVSLHRAEEKGFAR